MDWFLYDNGPRHERVKCSSFCYLNEYWVLAYASERV